MSDFYLTLPSSANHIEFADNKPNSFKIRFPRPLIFDRQWKVALASISLPESRLTLRDVVGEGPYFKDVFQVVLSGSSTPITVTNTVGPDDVLNYKQSTGESFMKCLTYQLKNKTSHSFGQLDRYLSGAKTYTMSSSGYNRRTPTIFRWDKGPDVCFLETGNAQNDGNNHFSIKKELAHKMGWIIKKEGQMATLGSNMSCEINVDYIFPTASRLISEIEPGYYRLERHTSWRFNNLNAAYDAMTRGTATTLYVYSDVCKKSIVGSQPTDFLREVPYFSDGTGNHYFEPTVLRHLPVQRNVMETVEIQIASDHTAELAEFSNGTTTVCLHFKKDDD